MCEALNHRAPRRIRQCRKLPVERPIVSHMANYALPASKPGGWRCADDAGRYVVTVEDARRGFTMPGIPSGMWWRAGAEGAVRFAIMSRTTVANR